MYGGVILHPAALHHPASDSSSRLAVVSWKIAAGVLERHLQVQDAQDEEDDGGLNIDLGDIFGIGCFSELATVHVQGKGEDHPVAMKDLQVGDKVWNGHDFSTVYTFGHRHPSIQGEFLQIHTTTKAGNRRPLEMTAEHLVYLQGQSHPVRADSVVVGDSLQGKGGSGSSMKVTKINKVERHGLYAPFTVEGTVVVDGVKASSYISLQAGNDFVELENGASLLGMTQHDYVHMGLSPMRLLCVGISSHYCSTDNEAGMPFYARLAVKVNQWINGQPVSVQAVLFSSIVVLTGTSIAMEAVFGPARAPLAVLSVVTVFLAWRKKKASSNKQKAL